MRRSDAPRGHLGRGPVIENIGAAGGFAAATVPVTPGDTLLIDVGCPGLDQATDSGTPGAGGFPGGGDGGPGSEDPLGGGGGLSRVSLNTTANLIVVAGGGGGGGGSGVQGGGGDGDSDTDNATGGGGGGSSDVFAPATSIAVVNGTAGGQVNALAGAPGSVIVLFQVPPTTTATTTTPSGAGGGGTAVPDVVLTSPTFAG